MTTKTADEIVDYQNGHAPALPAPAPEAPQFQPLSAFQKKYMQRLISNFERAQEAVGAAQNAANEFIVACAEDAGITVGKDGWAFDQEAIEFIKSGGG
jgi:hypothetical protein